MLGCVDTLGKYFGLSDIKEYFDKSSYVYKIITDYSLPSSLFDYNHLPSILERLEKYKNESLKASIDGYYATIRAQSGAAAEWRKGEERRERLDRQYREEVARQNDREVLQSINNKLDYWIHH